MILEPEIDKNILRDKLLTDYGLFIDKLIYIPKGEVSYGYLVETHDKEKYFLKLLGSSRMAELSKQNLNLVLALTDEMSNKFNIKNISYPVRTKNNQLKSSIQDFPLILYPFIDGENFSISKCSDDVFIKLTQLLARIHSLGTSIQTPILTEDYEIIFKADLINGLNKLDDFKSDNNSYKQKLAELLLPIKEILIEQLHRLEYYQDLARKINKRLALVHTDPTPGNLMVDKNGKVYIIDWEGAKFAPQEHDFMFFLGDRFDLFMEYYQQIYGKINLNTNVFAFYFYKRYLEDLTDWVVRILYENTTDEQNKADLQGIIDDCLGPYKRIEEKIKELDKKLKF